MSSPAGSDFPVYRPYWNLDKPYMWYYSEQYMTYVKPIDEGEDESVIGCSHHMITLGGEYEFTYDGIRNEIKILESNLTEVVGLIEIKALDITVAKSLLIGDK